MTEKGLLGAREEYPKGGRRLDVPIWHDASGRVLFEARVGEKSAR
jgi:hypothetical protein